MQLQLQGRGCTRLVLNCNDINRVLVFESPPNNSREARDTNNYMSLENNQIVFSPSGTSMQNATVDINFRTGESGFYLTLRETGTCITVSRILVFYNVCPEEVADLVMRPETIAPPNGLSLEVQARCVEGAEPENGEAARLTCLPGGNWSMVRGSGCRCQQELQASQDGRACRGKSWEQHMVIATTPHIIIASHPVYSTSMHLLIRVQGCSLWRFCGNHYQHRYPTIGL